MRLVKYIGKRKAPNWERVEVRKSLLAEAHVEIKPPTIFVGR